MTALQLAHAWAPTYPKEIGEATWQDLKRCGDRITPTRTCLDAHVPEGDRRGCGASMLADWLIDVLAVEAVQLNHAAAVAQTLQVRTRTNW